MDLPNFPESKRDREKDTKGETERVSDRQEKQIEGQMDREKQTERLRDTGRDTHKEREVEIEKQRGKANHNYYSANWGEPHTSESNGTSITVIAFTNKYIQNQITYKCFRTNAIITRRITRAVY